VQPDIFAVMNYCVVALSLFSSDIPLGALIDYIQGDDTKNKGNARRRRSMHIMSTNFAKTLVWKN